MESALKTIGYFAVTSRGEVVCDGPACIIAGSYKTMQKYLAMSRAKPPGKLKIIKTRFGEIMRGIKMGGVYSFDEESYGTFLILAREDGMPCDDLDFTPDRPGEIKFVTLGSR